MRTANGNYRPARCRHFPLPIAIAPGSGNYYIAGCIEIIMEDAVSHILWYPGNELLLPDIARAENCHLYDSGGRKYVDLESGVWCTSLGHNHPRIIRTLIEQTSRIAHAGFNYSAAVVEETAREILSLLKFDGGACVFLCSGSEAVEYGVRVAQTLLSRPLMMTMTDSYFGAYGSAAERPADRWFCFDWSPCADCDDHKTCDSNCDQWNRIPSERIGGFLFEPGSSSGLVRFPPEKLIRAINTTIKENGGFLLINEVTTGIGRTGQWFGYQHYGVEPDVVSMGKGIGNGYPVSVTAFAPRMANNIPDRQVKYAQSHQNDPLGAAVVREVIRIIHEDGLIERGREIGSRLVDGLAAIEKCSPKTIAIRSRGLMVAVELHHDRDLSFTIRVHRELARRGYIVGRRHGASVLRIDPSLTTDAADIDGFLEAFEDVLAAEG